jgi:hypothetical protein
MVGGRVQAVEIEFSLNISLDLSLKCNHIAAQPDDHMIRWLVVCELHQAADEVLGP